MFLENRKSRLNAASVVESRLPVGTGMVGFNSLLSLYVFMLLYFTMGVFVCARQIQGRWRLWNDLMRQVWNLHWLAIALEGLLNQLMASRALALSVSGFQVHSSCKKHGLQGCFDFLLKFMHCKAYCFFHGFVSLLRHVLLWISYMFMQVLLQVVNSQFYISDIDQAVSGPALALKSFFYFLHKGTCWSQWPWFRCKWKIVFLEWAEKHGNHGDS